MATMRHEYHLAQQLLQANVTVPTRNETRESSLNNGESTTTDSNMVIILAALLCALICALGLNSIVRCALRCRRRLTPETPDEIAARLASRGMKKDELTMIPEVVYKSGLSIPATDCPICLGDFREGEIVRILPRCNHGFHVNCIDTWLLSHSSCPTCRQLLSDHSSMSTSLV